jgi:hypothetical protein
VEIMRRTNSTIASMVGGNKATDDSVTFGVGTGAFGGEVFRSMAVGATMSKGWVRESVLDSPAVFEPGSEGLLVSRLGINLDTLGHGVGLRGRWGCSAEGEGASDAFALVHVGVKLTPGLCFDELLTEGERLTSPVNEFLLQGSPLTQQTFVLEHVASISVDISSDSVVPKFVQGYVNLHSAWVACVKYSQGLVVGLSRGE